VIRRCADEDFDAISAIINEAAEAYRGVIPPECWKDPYMPGEELRREIDDGVVFWGSEEAGRLIGVMGIQQVVDVALIRHAYVRRSSWPRGVGAALLAYLRGSTERPLLVGTWKDAAWAVLFYEKHCFRMVTPEEKDRLLKKYWSVPERQIRNSVVLADERWFTKV
jgi:N-acetylglutamate synthase-like GNAT family acetyltransferase